MSEVTRNDLMYFQDEVLSDIKKLESRFGIKLEKAMEQIKNKFETTEETFTEITNKITELNYEKFYYFQLSYYQFFLRYILLFH